MTRALPDLWGASGPSCPDGCSPVNVSIPLDHGSGTCDICPHVRCAICGAWAEPGDPDELAAAWPLPPVAGQTSWLD